MKRLSALTLIEILVVVSLIGIISLPLYISYTRSQANQGLRSSSEQLVNTFQTAHIFAREAKDKKHWGVKSTSDTSFALIKGSPNSSQVEKTTTLEPYVSFADDFEVWFDAGTGETQSSSMVLVQNTINRQVIIDIFTTGVVEIRQQ